MPAATNTPPEKKYMLFNSSKTYYYVLNCRVIAEATKIVLRLCLECLIHERCPTTDEFEQSDDPRSTWCNEVEGAIRRSYWFKCNNIFYKHYKKSDFTNLMGIILEITNIQSNQVYSTLKGLLMGLNKLRNNVIHEDRISYDPKTKNKIHDKLKDILLHHGKLFPCCHHKPVFFQSIIQEKINEICPPNERLNDKILIDQLKQLLLNDFPEQWSKIFMKQMKSVTLPCDAREVSLSDIFQKTDLEVISDPNEPGSLNPRKLKTFPSTDIFSQRPGATIDIITGDPGAGKSIFLKKMCLNFDEKVNEDIIKSFDMMFYFDANTRKNSFWEFFTSTCSESIKNLTKAQVIRALSDLKIIIAIDGFDECKTASETLVTDTIQTFSNSKTVKFLITTRPVSTKEIVKICESQEVKPRVLNMKSIQTKKNQEKFIKGFIAMLPDIDENEILKAFRDEWDELKSHFVRPIGLINFISLLGKSEKPSHELDLEQLMYCKVLENMAERIPKRPNSKLRANNIMEILGKCCLHWIQSKKTAIDETIFEDLSRKIFKKLGFAYDGTDEISVDSLLSCVFQQQESTTNEAKTYNFLHRNQCEFYASRMLTTQLTTTSPRSVLNILQQLTQQEKRVTQKNFVR